MSIKETQLAELAAQLEKCSSCHLRGDCQAPVGWYGCPDSPIIFIGEGPGGVEDDYGCPLIGPSGQLLVCADDPGPGADQQHRQVPP